MRRTSIKARYATIKIVIIVAAIAVIGILGYKFYTNYQEKTAVDTSNVSGVPPAPPITTTIDLDKAAETMDETMLDTSNNDDLSELDKELAEF